MKNIPEFSVSEITSLTKNILEENFDRVRIRGEVSKIKENKGHLYFSLKDENFVLNAICWSSAVPLLQVFPEEGMEVVAEGKITTYAKSSISSYQIKVDQIELQGVVKFPVRIKCATLGWNTLLDALTTAGQ